MIQHTTITAEQRFRHVDRMRTAEGTDAALMRKAWQVEGFASSYPAELVAGAAAVVGAELAELPGALERFAELAA